MRGIHLTATLVLAGLVLAACAHKKQVSACSAIDDNSVAQAQLKSLDQAIERAYGKPYSKQRLTMHANPPVRDARGRLVWHFYDIHPADQEPAPVEAQRKLTLVLDPCTRRLLDSSVPKA